MTEQVGSAAVPEATTPREGWAWPGAAHKAHYFVGAMSLCRKWGFYFGPLEADENKSLDDCVVCRRELDKRPLAAPRKEVSP